MPTVQRSRQPNLVSSSGPLPAGWVPSSSSQHDPRESLPSIPCTSLVFLLFQQQQKAYIHPILLPPVALGSVRKRHPGQHRQPRLPPTELAGSHRRLHAPAPPALKHPHPS
jgi:hypothetical protein